MDIKLFLKNFDKDFLIVFFGKIIQVLIVLITIKVVTIYLEPKEMGNMYLMIAICSLFMLSFFNPVGSYIYRHVNSWKKDKIILNTVGYFFIFVVLFSAIGLAILSCLLYFNKISIEYSLMIIFLYNIFVFFNPYLLYVLNILHSRSIFTVYTILTSLVALCLSYIFIRIFGNTANNWLAGIIFANITFTFISFITLKKKLEENFHGFLYNLKKVTKIKLKSILVFILPLSVATLFMWLQNSGYRILIEQNIGLEFLGFLGVGLAISGQIASIIESIVMQYFHPIYYKQITNATIQERKKAIESFINKALPIYFMLAIFLTFLAKYVVEILVDEKYYGVYIFTTFGIWIEFFRMSSNLFGNISQSEMNTKKFMAPYIIGSLVTVFLVYFSSLKVDYEFYLPIALLIGGIFTMIVMYISMKKLIDFKIDFRLIFLSFLISVPYISIYFFNFQTNLLFNLLIVGSFGLYFLGTIYFIYKKGLSYGNS